MNTKALNALADVICRAQEQNRTPMGIAFAVDSAGMHMSPETAADQEQLRLRVDEVERKYIFDTAELKRQLESSRVDGQRLIRAEQRRAELEAVLSTHRNDDERTIAELRARVAELEAGLPAMQEALFKALDRVTELEAERHSTNEALDDAAKALRVQRDRVAALAERLRAGQEWQRGRTPELVSENLVSQSELREIFGIPLVAPWGDGITRQIVPVQALREDGGERRG